MTATRTRGIQSSEDVRAALIELGLRMEEKPIDGRAFTIQADPLAAVQFYRDQNGGREPTRFYCYGHQFILSD